MDMGFFFKASCYFVTMTYSYYFDITKLIRQLYSVKTIQIIVRTHSLSWYNNLHKKKAVFV